ncbi:MAG: hypothetical protein WC058_03375 [Phycisphaeraceae bacterium]
MNKDQIAFAEAVASAVDIIEVRLLATRAKQKLVDGQRPKTVRLGRGTNTTIDRKKNNISVSIRFVLDGAENESTSWDETPLRIEATFGLSYKVRRMDDFNDEQMRAFGEINGAYNAWPFWREFVYSTLARMGLPPLTLPVFRIEDGDQGTSD